MDGPKLLTSIRVTQLKTLSPNLQIRLDCRPRMAGLSLKVDQVESLTFQVLSQVSRKYKKTICNVSGHHYLYDIISSWEVEQNLAVKAAAQSKVSPAKNQQQQQANQRKPAGASDNRFIFKKRLFKNTREIPGDPVEVSLLFAQAVHSIVRCDELPVSEKVALQLAGLQAQVALGEPQAERPELYQDVDMFISQRIKTARFLNDREWIPVLMEAHSHYGAGKAEIVSKVWYLRCVMQYPLYGSTMFSATNKSYRE